MANATRVGDSVLVMVLTLDSLIREAALSPARPDISP
jgi:hypothetical protein